MSTISLSGKPSGHKAYRVVPDPDDPIILQIDGKLCQVMEISATGFNTPDDVVTRGRRYPFSMDLPTSMTPINGYVDVLDEGVNSKGLGYRFVDLATEELDALHHYVLVRQKQAIRALRAARDGLA
ncbi:MAG: hypothetical protein CSA54_04165 [Gammaproteobacteria bacterium]|nr:MAG: hypothetical protein CSA54_04165 [Gammaproteobacteria bacterium]